MLRFSLLLLFIPASLGAQTAAEKQASVKFLAGLQQPDGGYVAAPIDPKADAPPRSTLRATSGAVRAIKYLGGEVPDADRTARFVMSCYDAESGGFADQPGGKPDVTATAIGMMAAAALYPSRFEAGRSVRFLVANAKTFEERRLAVAGMEAVKTFPPAVKEWLGAVEKTRNADGTHGTGEGQARDTGGVAAMILRSGGTFTEDQRAAVVKALKAGQRPDGGFGKADAKGSDGEATYRVMRAFYLLKEKPNDLPGLRAFLAKCRNADGGSGVAPGQPSTVAGTYYAAVISHWLAD